MAERNLDLFERREVSDGSPSNTSGISFASGSACWISMTRAGAAALIVPCPVVSSTPETPHKYLYHRHSVLCIRLELAVERLSRSCCLPASLPEHLIEPGLIASARFRRRPKAGRDNAHNTLGTSAELLP
jgi:hypothetical protein